MLLQIISLIIAAALGLFGAGYLLARLLRYRTPSLLAFPISLLILFHCIFVEGLLGVSITFGHVLIPLFCVSVLLAWGNSIAGKRGRQDTEGTRRNANNAFSISTAADSSGVSRLRGGWKIVLLLFVALMVLMMIQQALLTPLSGYDTLFRWDYLAGRILQVRNFNFYPPRRAADFKNYFYVDGFAPIISFAYWWVYAASGEHVRQLSALVVVPQYIVVLCIVYKLASYIADGEEGCVAGRGISTAGLLAAAVLAGSNAYFRDQVIGQETGMTALSLVAMVYVLLSEPGSWRSMILAGACASVGAMCREYGWAYVLFGMGVILFRDRSVRLAGIFLVVCLVIAGPWYARNFVLTGNPFFSLKFFGFPVNQAFSGLLESCPPHFGVMAWDARRWGDTIGFLLAGAPVQLTFGVIAMVWLLRRRPVLAAAVVMSFALWLYSAGYTNGGTRYSTRTLTPAWAILSICAGVFVAGRIRGSWVKKVFDGLMILAAGAAIVDAWIFPFSFFNPPTGSWAAMGVHPHPRYDPAELIVPQVERLLPHSCRILGDDLLAFVYLQKAGYQLVPPWSPEVSFLFDPKCSADQSIQRLRRLNICAVLVVPSGTNTFYFVEQSRFYQDPHRWTIIGGVPGLRLFRLPR